MTHPAPTHREPSGGPSRPDYHAVLRHEEELGNEPASSAAVDRPEPRRSHLNRWGVGLALAALAALPLVLAGPLRPSWAAGILVAATGVLGVYLGHFLARRELHATPLGAMERSLDATLERQLEHERNAIIGTITSLISAMEARDPSTRNHSARVAKLAVRVARNMGLALSEVYEIHLGGLLHDIGKIGIPDRILLKPGGLTPEEYAVMKTHSILGARMLAGIPGLERVAEIVLSHHEMIDGRGYPYGRRSEEIPLGARIIAVCDTYMSMAEDRPYREGRDLDRVLREIRRVAGHQLDAGVVGTLEKLLAQEIETYGHPIDGFRDADEDSEAARFKAA